MGIVRDLGVVLSDTTGKNSPKRLILKSEKSLVQLQKPEKDPMTELMRQAQLFSPLEFLGPLLVQWKSCFVKVLNFHSNKSLHCVTTRVSN